MPSLPETDAPLRAIRRLLSASTGQARRTPRCPETPRLDGRLAVLTGATGGIGAEIARGLRARGADLVLPCRSPAKAESLATRLLAEPGGGIDIVEMDMEDLASVREAGASIARTTAGRPVDLLIENAGLWPARYAVTRQGHEIAFGVNVLAHFALRQRLLDGVLAPDARIVGVTGDIYILESDCTPDHRWRGRVGGMRAYCRSKLGNLWIARELRRRHPRLDVYDVHPGVVDTGLGGPVGALGAWIKARTFISPELGAQTPLITATQDDLVRGGYYHNVHGRMRLDPSDPALDPDAPARLWATCEALLDA